MNAYFLNNNYPAEHFNSLGTKLVRYAIWLPYLIIQTRTIIIRSTDNYIQQEGLLASSWINEY